MALQNKLKAFVRFDGSGRVIPSSLILQKSKPKVGNWKEIIATECCNGAPSTTTTTTTQAGPVVTAYGLTVGGYDTRESACQDFNVNVYNVVYSSESNINNVSKVYFDQALTTQVFGYDKFSSLGYYNGTGNLLTNGVSVYMDSIGNVMNIESCSITTTTTTTGVPLPICDTYFNTTGSPFATISYTDCNGVEVVNAQVNIITSVCVTPGTVTGEVEAFEVYPNTCNP
jgi:hypothetical protein